MDDDYEDCMLRDATEAQLAGMPWWQSWSTKLETDYSANISALRKVQLPAKGTIFHSSAVKLDGSDGCALNIS